MRGDVLPMTHKHLKALNQQGAQFIAISPYPLLQSLPLCKLSNQHCRKCCILMQHLHVCQYCPQPTTGASGQPYQSNETTSCVYSNSYLHILGGTAKKAWFKAFNVCCCQVYKIWNRKILQKQKVQNYIHVVKFILDRWVQISNENIAPCRPDICMIRAVQIHFVYSPAPYSRLNFDRLHMTILGEIRKQTHGWHARLGT